MLTKPEFQFLKQKIYGLNTAVFFNDSNSVLKMPNNIISVYQVDEIGQIWFFLKPPRQYIREFEKSFYAHLQFLKKGRNYFLKIEGKVYLVTDPEEINELTNFPEQIREKARKEEILVKMKVANISYYEIERKEKHSWLKQLVASVYALLNARRPARRVFQLETDTAAF